VVLKSIMPWVTFSQFVLVPHQLVVTDSRI